MTVLADDRPAWRMFLPHAQIVMHRWSGWTSRREAGYSGRDLRDVRTIAERRKELYVVLPISEVIADRAREVQIRMAARGHHRAAGVIGLLTAAVAEYHGAVMLLRRRFRAHRRYDAVLPQCGSTCRRGRAGPGRAGRSGDRRATWAVVRGGEFAGGRCRRADHSCA
jgi:predicted nucleic acid-binding protein